MTVVGIHCSRIWKNSSGSATLSLLAGGPHAGEAGAAPCGWHARLALGPNARRPRAGRLLGCPVYATLRRRRGHGRWAREEGAGKVGATPAPTAQSTRRDTTMPQRLRRRLAVGIRDARMGKSEAIMGWADEMSRRGALPDGQVPSLLPWEKGGETALPKCVHSHVARSTQVLLCSSLRVSL